MRPGSPISGPDALLRNIGHDCVLKTPCLIETYRQSANIQLCPQSRYRSRPLTLLASKGCTSNLSGTSVKRKGAHEKYPMLRNSSSGPDIGLPGRILARFYSGKPQDRPSGKADSESFPIRLRTKSGPGQRSGFRDCLFPDSIRESLKTSPPAGLRAAGGPILSLSQFESGRNAARKPDFRPGCTIA